METIQNDLNIIKELLQKQNIQQKEILTLDEVSDYLCLSKSCIYKMTSKKEIPFYCPMGKKIYFLKSELYNWVVSSKVTPINEITEEVENYLGREIKSRS